MPSLRVTLWGLFVLNTAVGLGFSRATTPRYLRIESVQSQATKEQLLQASEAAVRVIAGYKDAPFLRINRNLVNSAVERVPGIEQAEYIPNIFGRGVLKIIPQTPIAVALRGQQVIDKNGDAFRAKDSANLPAIARTGEKEFPGTNWAGSWPSRWLANAATTLQKAFPDHSWTLEINGGGRVVAVCETKASIVLGTTEKLNEKISKLDEIVRGQPKILNVVNEINLSSLNNPAAQP